MTTTSKAPRKATLTLTSYSCGSAMGGEADFDAWAAYVAARIDERTGLDVTVERTRWENPGAFKDEIACSCSATDEACACREDIDLALATLWEEFCADASAWPVREEQAASELADAVAPAPSYVVLVVWGHGASTIDAVRSADSDLAYAVGMTDNRGRRVEDVLAQHDDAWCVTLPAGAMSESDLDADPAVIGYAEQTTNG